MASNLYRLLSSPIARPEFSNSASRRLIVTTAQLFQNQKPETKEFEEKDEIYRKTENETNFDSKDEQNGGEDSDEVVNKQTGEIGGPRGPEPTRYGDWEQKGRCSDF